ncbi:MAG: hypothetical protein LBU84_14070 [Prevotella sp.]|jgi:hypothetical protein|nr:hypothetical protein [Prevotella sp.]
MRNTNLRQVDYFSALFDSLDMLDVRLMAYKSQARTYLLSNADDIISKYAKLIYQELCIQNTEVQNHYYGELKTGAMGRSVAYEIISAYTTICEDVLILFNPLDKEPAVVEDAYIFSDYDIGAFEEKILSEYIERKKKMRITLKTSVL